MNPLIPSQITFDRACGILLHPTSLHTPFGIGDFGSAAFHFIDYLIKAGQTYWQMLPLGPTGYLDSPYQCISAFAGNSLLIAPDGLINMGLASNREVICIWENLPENNGQEGWINTEYVNYTRVREAKEQLFLKAFQNFTEKTETFTDLRKKFDIFKKEEKYWLDDFVLFLSLKKDQNLQSWIHWDAKYKDFRSEAVQEFAKTHHEELELYRFTQWLFDFQWNQLHEYATQHGVKIIGDMPIFVAHDSSDVWAHPDQFTLNSDGSVQYQAGVPPDYFSKTGQLWGNPLYNWEIMEKQNYSWWLDRFRRIHDLVDWIRVDHFRGFEAYWQVGGTEKTAIKGEWVKAPGLKLFAAVEEKLGYIPIIAENLGVITEEVENMRYKFKYPGMHVLQFGFTKNARSVHIPYNFEHFSFAYTGTHDNNTTLGFWQHNATKIEKQYFEEYTQSDLVNIVWDFIRVLYASVSRVVIIPMQDYLGEGQDKRMNTPGVAEGNWGYQMKATDMDANRAKLFKDLAILYGRIPEKKKEF